MMWYYAQNYSKNPPNKYKKYFHKWWWKEKQNKRRYGITFKMTWKSSKEINCTQTNRQEGKQTNNKGIKLFQWPKMKLKELSNNKIYT